jgi:hypothetical protein
MGFRDVANIYLDQAQMRFPPKTYKHKRYVFGSFLAHHEEDIPIVDLSTEDVMSYLNTRPSANNFNVHRKEMSSLFTYCIRTLKIITSNPLLGYRQDAIHSRPEEDTDAGGVSQAGSGSER